MDKTPTAVRSKPTYEKKKSDHGFDNGLVLSRALQIFMLLLGLVIMSLILHLMTGAIREGEVGSARYGLGKPRYIEPKKIKLVNDSTWTEARMIAIDGKIKSLIATMSHDDFEHFNSNFVLFILTLYPGNEQATKQLMEDVTKECNKNEDRGDFECAKRGFMYALYKTDLSIDVLGAMMKVFFEK